jgi:hypothetical protein
MEVTLRPLSLGEILDRMFQLYRSRFLMFAGIASFAAGLDLVWKLIQTSGVQMAQHHLAPVTLGLVNTGFSLISMVVYVLVSAVAMAATSRAVSALYLGQETGIGQAYREVKPHWFRYVRLYFTASFLAWGPAVLIFVGLIALAAALPAMFGASAGVGAGLAIVALVGLSMFVVVPFGVWMMLRYSLSNPACVFEDLMVRPSLKRSIQLSTGRKGSILVMMFLAWVISMVLTYAGLMPLIINVVHTVVNHSKPAVSFGLTIYSLLVGFVVTSITLPLYSIGLTLYYFDQRIRMEGFDVEWLLQKATPEPPPLPTASLPAVPTSQA